jgi:type IV pilus assembly protein PilA
MKKMNNKGFSLVELIIVIAIMAVLIAVLAPQYLKYVEKSRVSADGQTADEFYGAFQVVASDPDVNLDTAKTYSANSDATGNITISGDAKTALADVMDTAATYKYKSNTFKNVSGGVKIELKWDGTAKMWKIDHNIPTKSGS